MIINNSMVTESLSSTIITECELHDVIEEGYKGEIELLRAIIAAEPSPVTESGMSVVVEGVLGNFFSKLIGMIKKLFEKVISFFKSFAKSFSRLTNTDDTNIPIDRRDELPEDVLNMALPENLMPDKCEYVVSYIDMVLVNLTKALSATRDGIGMLFEKVKDEYTSGVGRILNGDLSDPPMLELDAGIIRGIKNIIANGFNVDVGSADFVKRCILGGYSKPTDVSRQHTDLLAKTSGQCTRYCDRINIRACENIAHGARDKTIGKINEFAKFIERNERPSRNYGVKYVDPHDGELPSTLNSLDSRGQLRAYDKWNMWAKEACTEFFSITSTLFNIICRGFREVQNAQRDVYRYASRAISWYYRDNDLYQYMKLKNIAADV